MPPNLIRKASCQIWTLVLNKQTVSHWRGRGKKTVDSQMAFSRGYFAWGQWARLLYAIFKRCHLSGYSAEQNSDKIHCKEYVCRHQPILDMFLHPSQTQKSLTYNHWQTIFLCGSLRLILKDLAIYLICSCWILMFSIQQPAHSLKSAFKQPFCCCEYQMLRVQWCRSIKWPFFNNSFIPFWHEAAASFCQKLFSGIDCGVKVLSFMMLTEENINHTSKQIHPPSKKSLI